MPGPRLGMATLMGIVAVAAVDLGAGRFLATRDEEFVAALLPMAVFLQLGAWLTWRARNRPYRHAFGLGFVIGGLLGWLTLVWAIVFAEVQGGQPYTPPIRLPGGWTYRFWDFYIDLVEEPIRHRIAPGRQDRHRRLNLLIEAGVLLGPQLVLGQFGGLLGVIATRWRQRRTRNPVPPGSRGPD